MRTRPRHPATPAKLSEDHASDSTPGLEPFSTAPTPTTPSHPAPPLKTTTRGVYTSLAIASSQRDISNSTPLIGTKNDYENLAANFTRGCSLAGVADLTAAIYEWQGLVVNTFNKLTNKYVRKDYILTRIKAGEHGDVSLSHC